MKKNILLCVMLFMTLNVCAQSKISKIFCRELQDTVAIERTEKGVAKVYIIGENKSFNVYEKAAGGHNMEAERHNIEQAASSAYKKAGGQHKLRNIVFDKYGIRYGGGVIVFFSNAGSIEAYSINSSLINWADENKYSDKLLIDILLDFRASFVFPAWEGVTLYESLVLVL